MTIRSKQWYTKASRLPNSLAKVSIGGLRLFLFRQQDHRPDDRWKSKPLAGREREERVQGKETVGFVLFFRSRSVPPRKGLPTLGWKPWFSKFQICLGSFNGNHPAQLYCRFAIDDLKIETPYS